MGVAAEKLGVARSALLHWLKWGFLRGEQRVADAPVWVWLGSEEVARLDGTMATQGHGRWRIGEAQRDLGLSKAAIWEQARAGNLVAYRARVGAHWEWRLDPANQVA